VRGVSVCYLIPQRGQERAHEVDKTYTFEEKGTYVTELGFK
jgi:hypothetical protein